MLNLVLNYQLELSLIYLLVLIAWFCAAFHYENIDIEYVTLLLPMCSY